MAYKIVHTDSFQRDLDATVGYIAHVLENRIAAASLLESLEKCYDELERMPFMYEACHDPCLQELGYRKAQISRYILIYKVDEEKKAINILRLFHGRQDYEKLI